MLATSISSDLLCELVELYQHNPAEFFAGLLRKESLSELTRQGGRFRSFLLKSMNHFLTDQWRYARVQKRGGGKVISLDAEIAGAVAYQSRKRRNRAKVSG